MKKQAQMLILAVLLVCLLATGYAKVALAKQQKETRDAKEPALTHGNTMGRLSGEVLDLVKFYFNASPRKDIDVVLSTLMKELAKKGYSMKSLPATDSIRIGIRRYNLGKYSSAHHFTALDGNLWLDIVNYSGAEPIRGIIRGDQLHSGHFYGRSNKVRWIFITNNAKNNALTAVFHSDVQLVNIGVSLPIEIPDYSKMSQADLRCISTGIDTLYDVTRLVVRHLILQRYKGSRKLMRPVDVISKTLEWKGDYRHGRGNDYQDQTGFDPLLAPI